MKTLLHSGASRLLTLIYALALSAILPACTDDADLELPDSEFVSVVFPVLDKSAMTEGTSVLK